MVVGVHSLERAFQKNLHNVRQATRALKVGFPVAIDSDHKIWPAFGSEYWPALYFVDAKGQIRPSAKATTCTEAASCSNCSPRRGTPA